MHGSIYVLLGQNSFSYPPILIRGSFKIKCLFSTLNERQNVKVEVQTTHCKGTKGWVSSSWRSFLQVFIARNWFKFLHSLQRGWSMKHVCRRHDIYRADCLRNSVIAFLFQLSFLEWPMVSTVMQQRFTTKKKKDWRN